MSKKNLFYNDIISQLTSLMGTILLDKDPHRSLVNQNVMLRACFHI